jgi:hypothetical protein
MGLKYKDCGLVCRLSMFEDEQMHLGNANAEGECLTVEAMKTPGLRVSMMRATCNLPSRPSKIIAYPYKGCNRSGGQNQPAILAFSRQLSSFPFALILSKGRFTAEDAESVGLEFSGKTSSCMFRSW